MTIDASAVARVVGIETKFEDSRAGSVLFLPQRIAVFAQGATASLYSLDKWQATSAGAAGQRYGFGSPIHLILRELMPANGDGVGTIPVTVYPLVDHASGVAAAGEIAASGTATKAGSYRLRIGGVLSEQFVIPAGAVDTASVHGKIATAVRAVLEMPVTVDHTYGTVTSTPGTNTGNGTVTTLSASGDPTPGAWSLVCNTAVANGGVFTLTDPNGTVVSTAVTMTPGVGAATIVNQGGLTFTLTDGTTNFAVGDSFSIAVPAEDVLFVAKWKGASGNAIKVEVIGDSVGVVFTITQLSGGVANPGVSTALAQVGPVWESMAINAAPIEDTTILDAFQVWGEGRWNELVRKPLVVFTGVTHATVAAATAVSSGRRTDRINAQLVAPGSKSLPFVVAARQLARIAKLASNNPPHDYGSQRATGLLPGDDRDQWDFAMRDQAIKAGSSTVEIKDGVVSISDVVTFYRPTGEEPPAFRFVKNIVRLQNVLFNIDLEFTKAEWDGAPMVPDDQPVVNPAARKPKHAKAEAAAILDGLGDQAIIVNVAESKKAIQAAINSQNPDRLDLEIPVLLSGNTNIKGIVLKWGLFFGSTEAAA